MFCADFLLPLKYPRSSFQEYETTQNHILLNDISSLVPCSVSSNFRIAHAAKSDWANRPWRTQSGNRRSGRSCDRYSRYRGDTHYGVQFFIDLRQRHYYYLNEQVFRPLSVLELTRIPSYKLMLSYTNDEYKVTPFHPTHAYLWGPAVKHMLKDPYNPRTGYLGFDRYPTLIKELETRVEAHNQQAATFSGPPLTDAVRDLMRAARARGEVRLSDLENNIAAIERDVQTIRGAFAFISNAIEVGQYEVKADCCPTMLNTLRKYWIP